MLNQIKNIGLFFLMILTSIQLVNANTPQQYADMWKEYEILNQKGSNKDALNFAQKILAQAEKDKKSDQKFKALIHIYKNRMVIEENSEANIVKDLKSEIDKSKSADEKALLKMLLAQTYYTYYNAKRYKIQERTFSKELSQDFTFWDAQQFREQISELYLSALKDGESLKNIPLDAYSDIIQDTGEKAIKFQSFYDLLLNTSIAYFSDSRYPEVYAEAVEDFVDGENFQSNVEDEIYEQQKYLVPWKDFLKLSISVNARSSKEDIYQSLLQKWIFLHEKDTDDELLGWIDDLRLRHTYDKVWGEEKNDFYLSILTQNQKTYTSKAAKSLFAAREIILKHESPDVANQVDHIKTYQAANDLIKKYPNTYGAGLASSLINNIESKEFELALEHAVYPADPFKVFVSYRNLPTIQYKIFSGELKNVDFNNQKIEERWNTLNKMKLVRSGKVQLPGTKDFKTHSVEVPMEGLASGTYVILFYTEGIEKDFEKGKYHYAQLYSTQLSATKVNNGKDYTVTVLDRKTGQPLQAQVEIIKNSYQKKEAATVFSQFTNQKGEVLFPIKNIERNASYEIVLKNGQDSYTMSSGFILPYRDEIQDIQWSKRVKLFTDRAIYRPGQQVFFKGVFTESKLDTIRPVANQEVSVKLLDANYREVAVQKFTSNEFGSFAGFFRIPEGGLNGSFSLESEHGVEHILVEEYKRPTFEVKPVPIEGAFKLGDTIPYKGQAVAYSGANISNATVKYIIERQSYYPIWYRRGKIWPPYTSENKVIATGTITTDENGFFNIPFVAQAGKDKHSFYQYSVIVDVVDISGETRFLQDQISVGDKSVNPTLELKSVWEAGKSVPIKVGSKNLQNQAVASTFQLRIIPVTYEFSLKKGRYWSDPDQFLLTKAEHDKKYPYDLYKTLETDRDIKKGKAVWNQIVKVSGDTILNILPQNLPAGFYQVQATIIDGKDTIVLEQDFEVRTNILVTAEKDFVRLQLNKNQYKVGDTIIATFVSDYPNAYLKADIFQKNQVITSYTAKFDSRIQEWKIPVTKEMIGDVLLQYTLVAENRIFSNNQTISIPFENKENLKYEWITFRNKLLPGTNETWKLKIQDTTGKLKDIELLATMYDASLDQFAVHDFYYSIYLPSYARLYYVSNDAFRSGNPFSIQGNSFYTYSTAYAPVFSSVNFYNWSLGYGDIRYYMARGSNAIAVTEESVKSVASKEMDLAGNAVSPAPQAGLVDKMEFDEESSAEQSPEKGIVFRKNFNETAFFYPQLRSDEKGEFTINFTIPEALTTWKFLAFAHTKDLNHAIIKNEIVTQKDIMIQLNKPRFVRKGDEIYLQARISNLTDKAMNASAKIIFRDAQTNKDITSEVLNTPQQITTQLNAKSNNSVQWFIKIPAKYEGFIFEISATTGEHTDGESDIIPVLENRILLTESYPFFIKKKGKKELNLKDFIKQSGSSETKSLTFEYTSQPVWHALTALPYLNEDKDASATSLFNRYYAQTLAAYILKSIPESKKLLEAWKKEGSLKSALEKNQELKTVVLEATPWLRDAQDESAQMQGLLNLFTDAEESSGRELLIRKLQDLQNETGGICWYPGMPSNRYITQNIVLGFYRLQQLGAIHLASDENLSNWINESLQYLEAENLKVYNEIRKNDTNYLKNDHLTALEIHYLFLISHNANKKLTTAEQYFVQQAQKFALNKDNYSKAAIAIALYQWKDSKTPKEILNAFKQSAVYSENEGMYWKNNRSAFWYEAPIETQAIIIQAFDQIAKDDDTVDELKTWLLRQKQTSRWEQPKATADAVYALLLTGGNWKISKPDLVKYDNRMLEEKGFSMGNGYVKNTWSSNDFPKTITIRKKAKTPSWGALYHQYWEDLDKVQASSEELQVKRTLYKVVNTPNGETLVPVSESGLVKVGDKIRIKLELKFNKDVEFFHLQDTRASGFEPASILSGYKYQGGLGYYEVTGDVATHWFMDFVQKGNYVFEYTVYANVAGNYSSGLTIGECLYAPEFRFHSNGQFINIKN